ncbi:MAG TPA: NUDIX hydrolase [Patescibacteria group bacterium]|nr:NUDIX hydrolase [Patescibacteria group bacterium]
MAKEGRDSNRVAAILIRDCLDNILMGQRNDGSGWANPGGHLKVGEQYFEGALRELKEETGLDAVELKLIKMHKYGKILVYLFEAKVGIEQDIDTSGDPDKEFSTLKYCDPNDIKEDLHVPLERNAVMQYWMES